MDGGGAYGAGKATGQFDPLSYIKKPEVILRVVSWIFAIVVFGCIVSQASVEGLCIYNNDENACGFGTAIGVIAFLGLIGFLILDALFDNISSVQQRKYIVIADMGFSGFWTFMWFVCFCYLTDSWRKFNDPTWAKDQHGKSGAEAAIAFSFFSIASFAALTFLAVMKYRKGISEDFSSGYGPDAVGGPTQPTPSPYSSYPSGGGGGGTGGAGPGTAGGYPSSGGYGGGVGGETGDPYQQSPFGGAVDSKQGPGDFQPPTY